MIYAHPRWLDGIIEAKLPQSPAQQKSKFLLLSVGNHMTGRHSQGVDSHFLHERVQRLPFEMLHHLLKIEIAVRRVPVPCPRLKKDGKGFTTLAMRESGGMAQDHPGRDLAEPISAESLEVEGVIDIAFLEVISGDVLDERPVQAQLSAFDHFHGRVRKERLGQGRRFKDRVFGDGLVGLGALDSEALGPEELSVPDDRDGQPGNVRLLHQVRDSALHLGDDLFLGDVGFERRRRLGRTQLEGKQKACEDDKTD
jgi:hypothetical protein